MNLNKLSDKIVFSSLKYIKHGTLKVINHDGKEYNFGNSNERLHAHLKINIKNNSSVEKSEFE